MFVYQNVDRDICVTFKSNKPVANPEYVISIDHDAGTIKVNGQLMVASGEAAERDDEVKESNVSPVIPEPDVAKDREPTLETTDE